jgi:hypothetical protein
VPTCPEGHETPSTDFCDVCGIRVGAPAPAPEQAGAAAGACPRCGADRSGQFCETCGYSFAAGQAAPEGGHVVTAPGHDVTPPDQPAAPDGIAAAWTAVVTADRAYFDHVVAARGPDSGQLRFPADYRERRFPLSGPEMRIGRRSASRGLEPEIDLTGPPLDPGVSHLHAVLTVEPDGGWTVCDPGSANGTLVNGQAIPAGARVRLREGDRVCVGAWTMLTIQAA